MNDASPHPRVAVVGVGRLGSALAAALPGAAGPYGRGFDGTDPDGDGFAAVLLCVPDAAIAHAAAAVARGPLLGHCSGAQGTGVLGGREGFVLHPLTTVPERGAVFAGAGCTVAGSSPRALAFARRLARTLGMTAAEVADADRALYHAAASFAANFLVTVESCAERLMAEVGVPRALLVPLVEAAAANWASLGGERALTGPIARGDEATVTAQRTAIAERAPDLLPVFDALADATRTLADRRSRS